MSKRVLKYDLGNSFSVTNVSMPIGAEILSIQAQNKKITLWALCDDENEFEKRTFSIYSTGHELSKDNLKYLQTVILFEGGLVYHVFELDPKQVKSNQKNVVYGNITNVGEFNLGDR